MEIIEVKEIVFNERHHRYYWDKSTGYLGLNKRIYDRGGKEALKRHLLNGSPSPEDYINIDAAMEVIMYFVDDKGELNDINLYSWK